MKQPIVLPVIHYHTEALALKNAEVAFQAGCEGVFLIHMDGTNDLLSPVARDIKRQWPDKLIGVNYLGWSPEEAVAKNIEDGLDMTWTDRQLTHSAEHPWPAVTAVREALKAAPSHQLFAGVAFKYQTPVEPEPATAAVAALDFGFIPTTSGAATGKAADMVKLQSLRSALGDGPLAVASGVTPENAAEHAPYLTHILVATGVSHNFHELDFEKLCRLRGALRVG